VILDLTCHWRKIERKTPKILCVTLLSSPNSHPANSHVANALQNTSYKRRYINIKSSLRFRVRRDCRVHARTSAAVLRFKEGRARLSSPRFIDFGFSQSSWVSNSTLQPCSTVPRPAAPWTPAWADAEVTIHQRPR